MSLLYIPHEIMQGLDVCCFRTHHAKGVVLRVTQRCCLQWEQESSLPVLINLGHGMVVFSLEPARQNKREKKKKANAVLERKRGNLLKARTKRLLESCLFLKIKS